MQELWQIVDCYQGKRWQQPRQGMAAPDPKNGENSTTARDGSTMTRDGSTMTRDGSLKHHKNQLQQPE